MMTEGCGDEGKDKCHASDLEIAINTQKEKKLQHDVDKRLCNAGRRNHCNEYEKFVNKFEEGFSSFLADAYDTCVASELGGCPPVTDFFPWLSDKSKWSIDHGINIVSGGSEIISDAVQVVTPQVTPTPYMLSPTVTSHSTISTLPSTSTITPYYTSTATSTMTITPTVSPAWTLTLSQTTPTPTPQYRVP
jgi:hypothetical protein